MGTYSIGKAIQIIQQLRVPKPTLRHWEKIIFEKLQLIIEQKA